MRKSDLGNLVAAEMDAIMDSDEHRSLFNKEAKAKKTKEKDESSAKEKCKCPPFTKCKCKKDKKDKKDDSKKKGKMDKKSLETLVDSVLKLSEECDELGLESTAASMLKVADSLLSEAAGANTIEEMLKENPDLDVDVAVVKELPMEEEPSELFDPRLTALELMGDEDNDGDLAAQLQALEDAGKAAGADDVEALGLGMEDKPYGQELVDELGLSELEAASAEVDAWLQKHSVDDGSNDIDVNADLSNLLMSADKEVEDYLLDNNLNS